MSFLLLTDLPASLLAPFSFSLLFLSNEHALNTKDMQN